MNNQQIIKTVILAGGRDFGRCPIATQLPTALWPVADKTALQILLERLAQQGLQEVIICSNGDAFLMQESTSKTSTIAIKFINEHLPVGTAGCIRDAACGKMDSLLLVLPSNIITPPNIDTLIKAHHKGKSDLTVFFNPPLTQGQSEIEPTSIYICEPTVLKYIPEQGYYDIKESLIPALLRAGKNVYAAKLTTRVGIFHNYEEYLCAIGEYLENAGKEFLKSTFHKQNGAHKLWMASNVRIAPSARIYGPVVAMDNANICEKAVVFGPVILGRNTIIGRDSLIANSVLWDGAQVEANCQVRNCVLDYNSTIPKNRIIEEEAVPHKHKTLLQNSISKSKNFIESCTHKFESTLRRSEKINKLLNLSAGKNVSIWLLTVTLSAAFIWSYWPQITYLWNIWQRSDEYSSGLLVPFMSVYIIWSRRKQLAGCPIKPSLWGLAALLLAISLRYFGLFFMYGSAENLSVVATITSLVLLICGWRIFRKVFTTLVFLGLMLPLPRSVHNSIMLPLQSWATSSAVFCLEVLGYSVTQEGNIIHLNGTTVAVAEACNGLRMIMAFFVISGLVVLLIRRSWWEKLLVLVSSVPIGLACNSLRLTITAIAFTNLTGKYWEKIFHDFGGYAMMPVALAMVVLELWLIQKITSAPVEKQIIVASENTKKSNF